MSCDVGKVMESLENELSCVCVCVCALLILQPFHHFIYVTAHSPTLPSLHLRHRSFSNPSVALPTSQLILQPFRRFTYVTAHSPTFPSLYLRHSSFSNLSVASPTSNSFSNLSVALPTSQFILQPFRRFIYVIAHSATFPSLLLRQTHSPTLPSLYLRHCSFSNLSVALPTSQAQSKTFPSLLLRHSSFSNTSSASPVTSSSLMSPGEPPMSKLNFMSYIHLCTILLFLLMQCGGSSDVISLMEAERINQNFECTVINIPTGDTT